MKQRITFSKIICNVLLALPLLAISAEDASKLKETLLGNESVIPSSGESIKKSDLEKPTGAKKAAKPSLKPLANKEDAMIGKLDFKSTRMGDVIRALSDVSNVNIIATEAASQKQISVFLQDVSVKEALELVCKTAGLWFRQDKTNGTYRVMTTEEYQGDLVIYRDDVIKVFNILHPNPIIVATAIRDLYGNRVRLTLGVEDDTTMGTFGAAGAASATTRNIGGNTTGLNATRRANRQLNSSRGGSGRSDEQNEGIVEITEKLSSEQLSKLDSRMTEKGNEGTLSAEALKGFSQSEQPIYLTVNREHNLIIVRTSDTLAVKDIGDLIEDMDRPTPQVLLEMKILSLEIGDKYRQSFDLDYVPNANRVVGPPTDQDRNPLLTSAPINVTSTNTFTTSTGAEVTETQSGSYTTGVRNILGLGNFALEGGTFVYQFMNDKIRARIQLLQEDNKINTLSSPILLATNNKPARVFVGTEQVITTGFDAVAGATNGIAVGAPAIIPVTEIRNIGNTLQILPKINADKTITLLIQQDSSTLRKNSSSIPVPVGATVTNLNVDSVQTSNIQGTVVAKDGLTIAIGGLIDHSASYTEQKVPLLGDIPLLGELFKRKAEDKTKRELILLVTPHIVTAPAEAEDVTLDAVEAISDVVNE
jgi:type II secretory pathway component GspD/PulD (secretin)